jgi:hypothetical protein
MTVLLEQHGRSAPEDSKTVRVIGFHVPRGTKALTLAFDYAPRTSTDRARNTPLVEAAFAEHVQRRRANLDDDAIRQHRAALDLEGRCDLLHNLMNVVLLDASGRWRGRWDRNPSSNAGDLVLSESHASRGFLAGPIEPGRWQVAIECHGVFGEPVSWKVEVRAKGRLEPEEIAGLEAGTHPTSFDDARALASTRRRRSGPGWYFGEMHSHTVHSDGKWELVELATRARAASADFLCLTDHNTTSGLVRPGELPLTLIPGIELTTFHGHHPIYGTTTTIPWHEDGRVLGIGLTGQRARALGAIVGAAHPFVPGDPLCTGCRIGSDLDPAAIDLMEVWYRRWDSPGSDNEAAYALWNDFWRAGHRITAVGARDWHGPQQDGPFPGPMPFTGIFADDNTTEAILAGLRAGRVLVSGGPIVDLELRTGSGIARVGEVLGGASRPSLHVRVEGAEAETELWIFRSGERVRAVALPGPAADLAIGDVVDGPGWYRAELRSRGLPRAITNHVSWSP